MNDIRESMLSGICKKRGCDLLEAEVILERAADRLAGYTHAECVQRHPLPPGRDEACGTQASR